MRLPQLIFTTTDFYRKQMKGRVMDAILFSLILVLACAINFVKPFTIHYDNGGSFDYSSNLGNYNYKLDLPDQQREEQGLLELSNTKEESYSILGKYSFNVDGKLHTVYYTSGRDGYRARIATDKKTPSGVTKPTFVYSPPATTKKPEPIGSKVCESIGGSRCGK